MTTLYLTVTWTNEKARTPSPTWKSDSMRSEKPPGTMCLGMRSLESGLIPPENVVNPGKPWTIWGWSLWPICGTVILCNIGDDSLLGLPHHYTLFILNRSASRHENPTLSARLKTQCAQKTLPKGKRDLGFDSLIDSSGFHGKVSRGIEWDALTFLWFRMFRESCFLSETKPIFTYIWNRPGEEHELPEHTARQCKKVWMDMNGICWEYQLVLSGNHHPTASSMAPWPTMRPGPRTEASARRSGADRCKQWAMRWLAGIYGISMDISHL